MDSINNMVVYLKNLVDYKGFTYFEDVKFSYFDDMINYLKCFLDFKNVDFKVFEDIIKYLKGLFDFGNVDLEFFSNINKYIRNMFGYEDNKMDKNDIILDNMYSSAFKPTCYTREEIPKNYLPYGLIFDPKKYVDKVPSEINTNEWSLEIYDDCLNYINKFDGAESELEWHNDFIIFTNLQIAFYNNKNLIRKNEEFDLLISYTHKHIRNLRSYVAKNAQLFLECLIFCLEDQKILDDLSFKMIPGLLASAGSEKAVYREHSKNNLNFLVTKISKHFNQEILWIFFEHTKSLNKKISSTAGEFASEYFINSSREHLEVLDIKKLVKYLEPGLVGKNSEVKKSFKKIVINLPNLLSQENYSKFTLESNKYPLLIQIIKKEFQTNL